MEQIINELLEDGHADSKQLKADAKDLKTTLKRLGVKAGLNILVRLFIHFEIVCPKKVSLIIDLLEGSINFKFQFGQVTEIFKDHPKLLNLLLDIIAENEQRKIESVDAKINEIDPEKLDELELLQGEKQVSVDILAIVDHWGDRPNDREIKRPRK